jgi:hypothetical protein
MESKPALRWRRLYWIFPLCLITAGTSLAQETTGLSASSDIEILQLSWKKEVRLPRNFDPSVIPTNGSFVDPVAKSAPTTGSTATRGIDPGRGVVNPTGTSPSSTDTTFPQSPARLPVFYVYRLVVRNIGSKAIDGVAWDYLFIDPKTNVPLARHPFMSYERVPANQNKSVTLREQLRSPPVRVITSGQPTGSKLTQKAVIECVLYADNSVWRNPNGRPDSCELLRSGKPGTKRKHSAQGL